MQAVGPEVAERACSYLRTCGCSCGLMKCPRAGKFWCVQYACKLIQCCYLDVALRAGSADIAVILVSPAGGPRRGRLRGGFLTAKGSKFLEVFWSGAVMHQMAS